MFYAVVNLHSTFQVWPWLKIWTLGLLPVKISTKINSSVHCTATGLTNVIWEHSNPHEVLPVVNSQVGVMVWCGITSAGLIGPYFFEDNVTGASYLAMLDEYLWPAVRYKRLIFQHDGAPAHYERNVRNWLDHKFKNRWIGRRGPTEWPPRSPDLTPCDFFLWGYLKDLVYRQRPSTIAQLRATIERCCQEIPLEMFGRTCESVVNRFRDCVACEGQQLTD